MIIIYNISGILKFIFNLAILIMISRLFYAPFDLELQETNNTLRYYMPILGVIGSYLYLAAWFGWKSAYTIMKYFSVFLFLLIYPTVEKQLPTWASTTVDILILSALAYLVYRLGKFILRQFNVLKFRVNNYIIQLKNRR